MHRSFRRRPDGQISFPYVPKVPLGIRQRSVANALLLAGWLYTLPWRAGSLASDLVSGSLATGVPLVSSCTAPSPLFAKLTGLWLFLSAGGVCQHYVDGSCPIKCASVGLSSLAPLTSLLSCGRASKDTGRREQAIVSWRCIIGCEVLGKFEQSFRTIWASFLACFLNQPLTQLRASSTFSIVHSPCVP